MIAYNYTEKTKHSILNYTCEYQNTMISIIYESYNSKNIKYTCFTNINEISKNINIKNKIMNEFITNLACELASIYNEQIPYYIHNHINQIIKKI